MSPYAVLWLSAFVWTMAIELPIYAGFLRRWFEHWWAPVLLCAACQATTHPILWFLAPRWEPYWSWVLICEACVVLAEAAIIAGVLQNQTPRRAEALRMGLVTAFVANLVSTLIGFLII